MTETIHCRLCTNLGFSPPLVRHETEWLRKAHVEAHASVARELSSATPDAAALAREAFPGAQSSEESEESEQSFDLTQHFDLPFEVEQASQTFEEDESEKCLSFALQKDEVQNTKVLAAEPQRCEVRLLGAEQPRQASFAKWRWRLLRRLRRPRPALSFRAGLIAGAFARSVRRCNVCRRKVGRSLQTPHAAAHLRRRLDSPGPFARERVEACFRRLHSRSLFARSSRPQLPAEILRPKYLKSCVRCAVCQRRLGSSQKWPHALLHEAKARYRCSECDFAHNHKGKALLHLATAHGGASELLWDEDVAVAAMRRCFPQWQGRPPPQAESSLKVLQVKSRQAPTKKPPPEPKSPSEKQELLDWLRQEFPGARKGSGPRECGLCCSSVPVEGRSEHVLRAHLGAKRFRCPRCPHSAWTLAGVAAHAGRKHPGTDLAAETTLKALADKVGLLCERLFKRTPLWQVDYPERAFACVRCSAEVPSSGCLAHLLRHQNQPRFRCPLCHYATGDEDGVFAHLDTIHPEASATQAPLDACESLSKALAKDGKRHFVPLAHPLQHDYALHWRMATAGATHVFCALCGGKALISSANNLLSHAVNSHWPDGLRLGLSGREVRDLRGLSAFQPPSHKLSQAQLAALGLLRSCFAHQAPQNPHNQRAALHLANTLQEAPSKAAQTPASIRSGLSGDVARSLTVSSTRIGTLRTAEAAGKGGSGGPGLLHCALCASAVPIGGGLRSHVERAHGDLLGPRSQPRPSRHAAVRAAIGKAFAWLLPKHKTATSQPINIPAISRQDQVIELE